MKLWLLLVPILAFATASTAFAELRQIDLSIYGMD